VGLLSELFKIFADALEADPLLGGQYAKRTLCCGVKMHDVWVHDSRTCPQSIALNGVFAKWREEHPDAKLHEMPQFDLRPYGDTSGLCPECGFPTNHFGIYTVGKKCSYCGYVEKRFPRSGDPGFETKSGANCTLPPEGWWCSRKPGHKGPCAARKCKERLRYD
jgi:hypothetical protein